MTCSVCPEKGFSWKSVYRSTLCFSLCAPGVVDSFSGMPHIARIRWPATVTGRFPACSVLRDVPSDAQGGASFPSIDSENQESFLMNNNTGIEKNSISSLYKINGKESNGISQPAKLNGREEPKDDRSLHTAPAAPEMNHWTEIMSQGWNDSTSRTTTAWDTVLSDFDSQEIEKYWDRLMPTVSYLGTEQVAKIYHALCVAYRAHRGQYRKSGEPFIIHPVEVALLLSGLKMDGDTVMAGLLHDTVEDTDMTFAQVETLFGKVVRNIVEGETKVSKLPKLDFTGADEQAENLRQMFVAMTEDYRIIIVKLADRLHNMRTLGFMKPAKQIKISRETLDIFAPLAHRMGIWQFKSELEDTAFMYLYPEEYKRLNRRLRQHQSKFREILDKAQAVLQRQLNRDLTLQHQASKVEVFGRTKEIYSLWHKMETKGDYNLDHVGDVVALRVVITPKAITKEQDEGNETDRGVWLCYHVLGLVQHLPGFQPVPTRVKDYISFPKPNGYQSLHTALILNGQTIEVQIRTSLMNQVAMYGMASAMCGNQEELYNTPWLSSIKEWQNDLISSRDFVDSVRRELLGKRVFVFLRSGKILNLARGATAVDAAFQINLGLNMHGVEINGKPVPFSYQLQNGDVVSILTGEGKPATDWMRYAKSRSTRSKLRSYFRARQKESLREAGEILLLDYLWKHGPLIEDASHLETDFVTPTTVDDLRSFLPGRTRYSNVDDLLVAVGKCHDRSQVQTIVSQIFGVPKKVLLSAEDNKRSHVIPGSVVVAVHKRQREAQEAAKVVASASQAFEDEASGGSSGVSANSTSRRQICPTPHSIDMMLTSIGASEEYADPEQLCEDCLPVRGDQVVGTRTHDKNSITTVHRMGCPHAQRAINSATAKLKLKSLAATVKRSGTSSRELGNNHARVDSVTLRRRNCRVWDRHPKKATTKKPFAVSNASEGIPVKLQWYSDKNNDDSNTWFRAEVVAHAEDRRLLLADCSQVVSETAEILKTVSCSTNEHATMVFLVNVTDLEHLQRLMDRLGEVESVMSVERRFGSELL